MDARMVAESARCKNRILVGLDYIELIKLLPVLSDFAAFLAPARPFKPRAAHMLADLNRPLYTGTRLKFSTPALRHDLEPRPMTSTPAPLGEVREGCGVFELSV